MSKGCFQAAARFYGHVGLARIEAPTSSVWFPITAKEAARIDVFTGNLHSSEGWLAIETLNNRFLLVDAQQMVISLLDDGDDWPVGDPGQDGPLQDYAGISNELYRIMAAWAEQSGVVEHLGSPTDRAEALSLIEASGFKDCPEVLVAHLRQTRIHLVSGSMFECRVDYRCLLELSELEDDADLQFVRVREMEGVDRRLPLNKVAIIDLPLIELEAARLGTLEECK